MKKLFITLMTVCVIASCGGDKKDSANNADGNTGGKTEQNNTTGNTDVKTEQNNTTGNTDVKTEQNGAAPQTALAVKTPGDVLMVMADVMNTASAGLDKATSGEDVVKALENMAADSKAVELKYADMMKPYEDMSEEETMEKYPEGYAAVTSAMEKFYTSMMNAAKKHELTPEQEARIDAALSDN